MFTAYAHKIEFSQTTKAVTLLKRSPKGQETWIVRWSQRETKRGDYIFPQTIHCKLVIKYDLSCNKPKLSFSRNTCLSSSVNSVSFSLSLQASFSLFSNKSTSFLFGESRLCSLWVPRLQPLSLSFSVKLPVLAPEPPTVLSHCFNVNRMLCFLPSYGPKAELTRKSVFLHGRLSPQLIPWLSPNGPIQEFDKSQKLLVESV